MFETVSPPRSHRLRSAARDLRWMIVVLVVLLALLRDWRGTGLVMLSASVSVAGTALLLYVFDVPANLLTLAGLAMGVGILVQDGLIDPNHFWGTINCNGINAQGDICGVTTTSGMAWKIPGRVGDSPILGAGLYVDNAVGAAGSTGRGEANLYGLNSYLIVEQMRAGKSPKDAGMEALRRIRANTIEKRLLNKSGNPLFNLSFYMFNTKGEFAAVSMYATKFAVCTANGPETRNCEPLLPGDGTE